MRRLEQIDPEVTLSASWLGAGLRLIRSILATCHDPFFVYI